MIPPIRIKKLHSDAQIPKYQTDGASGMDLCAMGFEFIGRFQDRYAFEASGSYPAIIGPGSRALFATGIAITIPPGYEGQIRPRSGWAVKDGVTVLNSPGTIDSDFVGEIKVLLINLGHESVEIKRGERIAQLVIVPVVRAVFEEVEELEETKRGTSGFGSSGK